jgi:hypothetical protein
VPAAVLQVILVRKRVQTLAVESVARELRAILHHVSQGAQFKSVTEQPLCYNHGALC